MRFYNYLQEKYVDAGDNTFHTPVFENPTPKELKEACDNDERKCRFMISTKEKNFYAWHYYLLHEDAAKLLAKNNIHNSYPDFKNEYIWGIAQLRSGKLWPNWAYYHGRNSKDMLNKIIKSVAFASKWFVPDSLEKYFEDRHNHYNN